MESGEARRFYEEPVVANEAVAGPMSPEEAARMLRQVDADRQHMPDLWSVWRKPSALWAVLFGKMQLDDATSVLGTGALGTIVSILSLLISLALVILLIIWGTRAAYSDISMSVKKRVRPKIVLLGIVFIVVIIGLLPLKPGYLGAPWWIWLIIGPAVGIAFYFFAKAVYSKSSQEK
jgi:hypothetical protein